jgi:hypothetical protein
MNELQNAQAARRNNLNKIDPEAWNANAQNAPVAPQKGFMSELQNAQAARRNNLNKIDSTAWDAGQQQPQAQAAGTVDWRSNLKKQGQAAEKFVADVQAPQAQASNMPSLSSWSQPVKGLIDETVANTRMLVEVGVIGEGDLAQMVWEAVSSDPRVVQQKLQYHEIVAYLKK